MARARRRIGLRLRNSGLWLMDSAFREPNEIGESAVQAARLLFILPSTTIDPVNHHGVWFIDSVRFLMIVVVLVAVWHFVHPVILQTAVHRSEHDQIRLLLEKYATTDWRTFTFSTTSCATSPMTVIRFSRIDSWAPRRSHSASQSVTTSRAGRWRVRSCSTANSMAGRSRSIK